MTGWFVPGLRQALFAGCGLLAAAAVWPWLPSPGGAALHRAVPASLPQLPPLPPAGQFAAIAGRPLFSPSRRPEVVPRASGSSALDARYRLVGVMIAGGDRRALVPEGTRQVELRVGTTLDGWVVRRIDPDRVMLDSAAGEAVLAVKPTAGEPAPKGR